MDFQKFCKFISVIAFLGIAGISCAQPNESSIFKFCEYEENGKIHRRDPILISFKTNLWIRSDTSTTIETIKTEHGVGITYPIPFSLPAQLPILSQKQKWEIQDYQFSSKRKKNHPNIIIVESKKLSDPTAQIISRIEYSEKNGVENLHLLNQRNSKKIEYINWIKCGKNKIHFEDMVAD